MSIKYLLNIFVFAAGLFLLFQASLYDVNWLDYQSPIEYKDYKSIRMGDFKGLNRIGHTLDGDKEFAFIVTEIKTFKTGNKYNVVTLFHPSRSYTFLKEFELDDKLLNHELYHLHITEYCSRLLRKKIITGNSFENIRLSDLKQEIIGIEKNFQVSYDDDTYHGYVLNKQLFWQNKVDSLLLSLNDFKETKININN
jgi:hypothetical protein